MELVTDKLSNGREITYQIVDGTAYHTKTPDEVVKILKQAEQGQYRIRFFYGDTEPDKLMVGDLPSDPGLDWLEDYNTMGYMGRSTGRTQIPLVIHSHRSYGGPALLDHCIVRITIDKHDVYRHPNYHLPELRVRKATLLAQGKTYRGAVDQRKLKKNKWENIANFATLKQAERWIAFIQGERNSK